MTEKALDKAHKEDPFQHLVLAAPTVDITNLDTSKVRPNDDIEKYKEEVIVSGQNMIITNSHVVQLDGNLSISSYGSSDASTASSIFDDEDEIDANPSPAILTPVPNQVATPGQPMQFEVKSGKHSYSSSLPLCMMLHARSLYNKADSFKMILREICPEITIVSETWERKRMNLDAL